MDDLLFALTIAAAAGSGLTAGVFFAFSTFVMRALARLPAAHGIAAMQSINIAAITPPFMLALFGTFVVCGALALAARLRWDMAEAPYLVAGGAMYAAGVGVVTMAFNVPRNDALAALERADRSAERRWRQYVAEWTAWNHVRAAAALGTTGLMLVAIAVR